MSNRDSPVTPSSASPIPTTTTSGTKIKKAATFLTSESLKEIRNKLRRLSDESLYKDDILNSSNSSSRSSTSSHCSQQQATESVNGTESTHKNNNDGRQPGLPTTTTTNNHNETIAIRPKSLLVKESDASTPSAFVSYRDSKRVSAANTHPGNSSSTTNGEMNKFAKSDSNSSVGSNSTTSSSRNEWHSRRKSYGFEKMTPPADTMSFSCMESSTDSGIGRSGDLVQQQQQQMQSKQRTNNHSMPMKNGTIVHISNAAADNYQSHRRSFRSGSAASKVDTVNKRHSIAVAGDTSKSDHFRDSVSPLTSSSPYILNNTNKPQASVNGFNVIFNSSSNNNNNPTHTSTSPAHPTNNSKRVEFCKTEVHFAAESGRVNIVETDGKPPPTNNFRRRRSSTQFLSEQTATTAAETPIEAAQPRSSHDPNEMLASESNSNVVGGGNDKARSSLVESRSEEEVDSLRGILKNKPVKPKPYHLGENCADGESLFGVRLRPVSGDYSNCNSNWMTPAGATMAAGIINPAISLYKEPDSGKKSSIYPRSGRVMFEFV